jgi:hypothetical protein
MIGIKLKGKASNLHFIARYSAAAVPAPAQPSSNSDLHDHRLRRLPRRRFAQSLPFAVPAPDQLSSNSDLHGHRLLRYCACGTPRTMSKQPRMPLKIRFKKRRIDEKSVWEQAPVS